MATKKQKIQENKIFHGKEPVFDEDARNPRVEILKALNWYNSCVTNDKKKKYTIEFLKEYEYPEDFIKKISGVNDGWFGTVGAVSRMILNGWSIPHTEMAYFEKHLFKIAKHTKKVVVEEDKPAKKKPNIQEYIQNKANEIAGELEGAVDCFIMKKGNTQFDSYGWLQHKEVSGAVAKKIPSLFQENVDELKDVLKGKDDYLKESYSHWNKPFIKKMISFYEDIIDSCEKLGKNSNSTRKPRKKKAVSVEKLVSKIKYRKEEPSLKLASINPEKIIGASELWTYDVRYKRFAIYRATNDVRGLSLKGTTLKEFSGESVQRTLRKPESFLKTVMGAGKRVMNKEFKALKTKLTNPNGRISENVLLLKVV